MKAMILSAGRGERMRPLTDTTPKPLLLVAGKPIIVHLIDKLVMAGFNEIIINYAQRGEQFQQTLGNGCQFGANITYSPEGEEALETAGGIVNALHLLANETFLVVNGDIATDFPFVQLSNRNIDLAHLILVDNPAHHPQGDFGLGKDGKVFIDNADENLTYSGLGLYRPSLFKNVAPGKSKLGPLLRQAIADKKVTGQKYEGFWMDIGTPSRLNELDLYYRQSEISKLASL